MASSSSYVWKVSEDRKQIRRIRKASTQQCHNSPIFDVHGCKFHIELRPNGSSPNDLDHCRIKLTSDEFPHGVGAVKGQFTISLPGSNITDSIESKCSLGESITFNTRFPLTALNPNIIRIKLESNIIKMFDHNGKEIIKESHNIKTSNNNHDQASQVSHNNQQEFAANDSKYEELVSKAAIISSQMVEIQNKLQIMDATIASLSEEKKNDDEKHRFDEIVKEIQFIKDVMLRNQQQNVHSEFKIWCEQTLRLPEYYQVFLADGIEDLSVMKLITAEQLGLLGITKIGHKAKILHEIAKLKQKIDENVNYHEGLNLVDTQQ